MDKIGTAKISLTCQKCGGTVIEIPNNPTDNSIVSCKGCGFKFGRLGDIKAKAAPQIKRQAAKALQDALKSIPGFKPK